MWKFRIKSVSNTKNTAIVADVLLRRLCRDFPDCLTRAFADDTAIVLTDFHRQADAVMHAFREYGAISGLHLDMPKTVLIPLWQCGPSSFNAFLRDTLPEWSRAKVANAGKYLGFVVGPGKAQSSWTAAVAKYVRRVHQW